jgi:hypothetical protein
MKTHRVVVVEEDWAGAEIAAQLVEAAFFDLDRRRGVSPPPTCPRPTTVSSNSVHTHAEHDRRGRRPPAAWVIDRRMSVCRLCCLRVHSCYFAKTTLAG